MAGNWSSSYWSKQRKRSQAQARYSGDAGFRPCGRVGCGHDRMGHRTAPAEDGSGRLLVGACHHAGCYCFSYVAEGRKPAYEPMRS